VKAIVVGCGKVGSCLTNDLANDTILALTATKQVEKLKRISYR